MFRERELTLDMLLASACLPKVHHTLEIDGQPYWDGGYSANPAVFPLFYDCDSSDVLLVLLTAPRAGPARPAIGLASPMALARRRTVRGDCSSSGLGPPWGSKQSGRATFA